MLNSDRWTKAQKSQVKSRQFKKSYCCSFHLVVGLSDFCGKLIFCCYGTVYLQCTLNSQPHQDWTGNLAIMQGQLPIRLYCNASTLEILEYGSVYKQARGRTRE